MRGRGSHARKSGRPRNQQPTSLMKRLAQLEAGTAGLQPVVRTRPRSAQTYFGVGLVASGLFGCVAILLLPAASPEQAHEGAVAATSREAPARSWSDPVSAPRETAARAAATAPAGPPLDVPIARSGRGAAPFPLQVTGVGDAQNARVIFRNVPKTAQLSTGQRQDEHTWALRLADLDGLQLSLGEGTPDIFDITIEVASASGVQALRTVARVRLIGQPGAPAAGPKRSPPTSIEDILRQSKADAAAPPARVVDAPFRTQVKVTTPPPRFAVAPAAPSVEASGLSPEAERKASPPRPEGLSALGGPVHRPEAAENRQMWWKMPAPGWTPFERGQ
jgi:hypothetical protein